MNPSYNADAQDCEMPDDLLDYLFKPTEAAVEAWLGTDSDGPSRPLIALVDAYLDGNLSPEHRRRVEERLRVDMKFRERFARYETLLNGRKEDELEEAESPEEAARAAKRFGAFVALEREGIQVPLKDLGSRRYGPGRRSAPPPSNSPRLRPRDFGKRLIAELGTRSGMELVDNAFRIVAQTRDASPWIREVRIARMHGAIDSAVEYFLIRHFNTLHMAFLTQTLPPFRELNAEIERIEEGRESEELEFWRLQAGPPEWEALIERWDAMRAELLRMLMTRGEGDEDAEVFVKGGRPFDEGRFQVYGC